MACTRAQIDAICVSLPGAELSLPPKLISWKVGDKMFACFGGAANTEGVSVKTDSHETATMLIDAGAAVRAPYFRGDWVRLPFRATNVDEARHRLGISYDLIRAGLKKTMRDALPPRETD